MINKSFKIFKSSAGSGKTYTLSKNYIRIALKSKFHFKKILAVTNLMPRQIGNFISEVLVLGVPDIQKKGVNTIVYYPIPIHLQPAYYYLGHQVGSLPVTECLCEEVLSLPIFPEITVEQQDYVVEVIKELFFNLV